MFLKLFDYMVDDFYTKPEKEQRKFFSDNKIDLNYGYSDMEVVNPKHIGIFGYIIFTRNNYTLYLF